MLVRRVSSLVKYLVVSAFSVSFSLAAYAQPAWLLQTGSTLFRYPAFLLRQAGVDCGPANRPTALLVNLVCWFAIVLPLWRWRKQLFRKVLPLKS